MFKSKAGAKELTGWREHPSRMGSGPAPRFQRYLLLLLALTEWGPSLDGFFRFYFLVKTFLKKAIHLWVIKQNHTLVFPIRGLKQQEQNQPEQQPSGECCVVKAEGHR